LADTLDISSEKVFSDALKGASLFVYLGVFLMAKRNTSIANQRKELPLSIVWRVNDKN